MFINELNRFQQISELNLFLKQSGFFNTSGGEIKGAPAIYLEQSSTMADKVSVDFNDGVYNIPGGFYEFAKQYPLKNEEIYQGFVPASAMNF